MLVDRGRARRDELVDEMLSWLTDERLGVSAESTLAEAQVTVSTQLPEPVDVAAEVEPLTSQWHDEPARAFCRALRVLSVLPREIKREAAGFTELLDEGGRHRWSLLYVRDWLAGRQDLRFTDMAAELLEALHHQHVRVALTKIATPSAQNLRRSGDRLRDPFNFAEEEGILRPLRGDEPFWSGARYTVGNHLLWSLGLLSSPGSSARLTDLGRHTLARCAGDA